MKKYKNIINIKKLTFVYDAHKNKNNKNKRVIGIEQLCLSAVLKTNMFAKQEIHNDHRCERANMYAKQKYL